MSEIAVYVPVGQALTIREGSGIVGTLQENGRVMIDYEGNLYGAVNIVTFADRVHHAWGRHSVHYPTVARALVPTDAVARVGWYDPEAGVVDLDGPEDEAALSAWLGHPVTDEDLHTTGMGAR